MQEKGMLNHTVVHGVFVGPARSGKNSLMNRLLGKEVYAVSPSTGVAESAVHVKVIQKSHTVAANIEKMYWSHMDYDDEVIKLMLISTDPQQLHKGEIATESGSSINVIKKSLPVNRKTIDMTETSASSTITPIDILKEALKSKGLEALKQHFEKTWSLYLTNTGGQMEFQEVLPLLVSGPSIILFLFTFRLDRNIDDHYEIVYEDSNGELSEPYVSSLTTVEAILQTLASISAMGTFVYKGLQIDESPLQPKIFFVGTHKDKLGDMAEKRIKEVDEQLQGIIKDTSHYSEFVEYASPTQLIFTVNNFSKSDSDFHKIRLSVERVVTRNRFKMTSPTHWLIFSLTIRKLKEDVISYDLCKRIAKKCGIFEQEELDEALHFIHSKMGLIRYFPYEDVKNLVFVKPQHLFDEVTKLIVNTFTFENVSMSVVEEFKQRGIFSITEFKKIYVEDNMDMKPIQFGKLLEKLRIAAPFAEDKYFFPCVLPHALKPIGDEADVVTPVPPLLVTFKCGFCPKGVAGSLIKYLLTNEMNSPVPWELWTSKIFKDQVAFRVGPYDTIIIKICPTYFEINCIPDQRFKCDYREEPIESTCKEVVKAINIGIPLIQNDLNYVKTKHSLTFMCNAPDCSQDHPALLLFSGSDNDPKSLLCEKVNQRFKLPKNVHFWCLKEQVYDSPNENTLSFAGNTTTVQPNVVSPDPLNSMCSSANSVGKLTTKVGMHTLTECFSAHIISFILHLSYSSRESSAIYQSCTIAINKVSNYSKSEAKIVYVYYFKDGCNTGLWK